MAKEDCDKTTLTTYVGTFRFFFIPLGLKKAPVMFERALDVMIPCVCGHVYFLRLGKEILIFYALLGDVRYLYAAF